jgi:hypothetical protein
MSHVLPYWAMWPASGRGPKMPGGEPVEGNPCIDVSLLALLKGSRRLKNSRQPS